ncbi:protein FAM200C-like [Oratosquilla oratoria]|uniref:protein FAM200C-like n=1 Tax=Oratosquilla oratoria TaxID=337810 RepID=UPI003F76A769
MTDADNLKEDLIDLQVNQGCQTKFRTLPMSGFWCDQLVTYTELAKAALEKIILFPTTYLCEKAFSTMLLIKTTVRNRLQDADLSVYTVYKPIPDRGVEVGESRSSRIYAV